MAWRNIWRNKKRTILTMFSIFIAIFLSLFTRSLQKGTFGHMISNAVKLSTGYVQIHKNGYWENKTINETFVQSNKIDSLLKKDKNISSIIPRLESFALASSGKQTKGVMVFGTDIIAEDKINDYSGKIIAGDFLSNNDRAVLLGEELANYLQLNVGDSIVLLGQGYHGVTAAEQYLIKGILKLPIPQMNNELVFMPLKESQYFYNSENRLTSISLMLKNPDLTNNVITKIKSALGNEYEIMSWEELNKELVQFVDTKNIGSIIMLAILYTVVGFGVFGAIMMMTMERRKEFAIIVSIGMQKYKLLGMIFLETILIGFVAIVIGVLLAYPILSYFTDNPIILTGDLAKSYQSIGAEPIMPLSVSPSIFINQVLTVIVISFVAILYPLWFILKLKVLQAMRF